MIRDYVSRIKYTTYVLDANMRIIRCDDMFEEITGYTKEDVKEGKLFQQSLIVEEDLEYYFQIVGEDLQKNNEAYLEHRIRRKDGSVIFVFCLGANDVDKETGEPISIIRVTDMTTTNALQFQTEEIISEASQTVADLQEQLATDELTGLLRRGPFIEEVTRQIEANQEFAFIMLDIDNFKGINDIYGHAVGDDVLRQVSSAFKMVLRARAIICRMGGDEFAILLPNIHEENMIMEIIARINARLKNLPVVNEKGLKVTLSMGIKFSNNSESEAFAHLYSEADSALYQAKKNGKDGYVIYRDVE